MKTAALLCGCCGLKEEDVSRLRSTGLDVRWHRSLCTQPGVVADLTADGTEFLLVFNRGDWNVGVALQQAAVKGGLYPLNLQVVPVPQGTSGKRLEALVRVYVSSAADQRVGGYAHLGLTSRLRGALSRRALLLPSASSHYEPIPFVEGRCTVPRCSLCASACPEGAIQVVDNTLKVDSSLCTRCAKCLPVCPSGALKMQGLNSEDRLRVAGAWTRETGHGGTVLLYAHPSPSEVLKRSSDWAQSSIVLPMEVPCIRAIGTREVLKYLAMGFSTIAGVEDEDWCFRAHGSDASVSGLTTAQEVVRKINCGKRVFVFDVAHLDLSGISNVEAQPSHLPTRSSTGDEAAVEQTSILLLSASRMELAGKGWGIVSIDKSKCTVCGVCVEICPPRALVVEEAGEGGTAIAFSHSACTGCGLCQAECPEKCLDVDAAVDPGILRSTVRLVESSWILCKNCGKRVAPSKMIERLSPYLSERRIPVDLCSDCRVLDSIPLRKNT